MDVPKRMIPFFVDVATRMRIVEESKRKAKRVAGSSSSKEKQELKVSPPPLYSDEEGEVDTFDACLVVADIRRLEKAYGGVYWLKHIVEFWFDCCRKAALTLFSHPGDDTYGGLVSYDGDTASTLFHREANLAIDELNRIRKDVKLELVKLFKVNVGRWGGNILYMTFSAADKISGKIGIYQAALYTRIDGNLEDSVLGLFRDDSNDKILAIMTIKGAEKDLAARKKLYEDARAEARAAGWEPGKKRKN